MPVEGRIAGSSWTVVWRRDAVNAAGDIFAKTVVPKTDTLYDSELEQELMENLETAWLADCADSVVSSSLLPEMSLKCRQRPVA